MIRRTGTRRRSAFTLVELLVVISIIALLISILLPSLKKAREQAKSVVGLANLKSLSTGVLIYASEGGGRLPGPLHPAIYRRQTLKVYRDRGYTESAALELRNRQLTWLLHTSMGQRGESLEKNVADDVSTCPVMAGIVPDEHFDSWEATNGHYVFPTHYALNNYGALTAEQSGFSDNVRVTSPPYYFGLSPFIGASFDPTPPVAISRIRRSSEEWMIADAWYRSRVGFLTEFQQEGPYQSGWSGDALPHFAPHFKTGGKAPVLDKAGRPAAAARVRQSKSDGRTNTTFFDGHASSVFSQTFEANGFELLYGFRGTVSPLLSNPTAETAWRGGSWK